MLSAHPNCTTCTRAKRKESRKNVNVQKEKKDLCQAHKVNSEEEVEVSKF